MSFLCNKIEKTPSLPPMYKIWSPLAGISNNEVFRRRNELVTLGDHLTHASSYFGFVVVSANTLSEY